MDADGFVKVQRRKNHKRALKHSIRSCNPSACFSSDYLVKIGNWESRFCKFTEELQASRLFARLIYELEAISGNKNESVDLVCYALGNFHSSLPATYQLALIELLRRQSFFSDSTVVYDPVFDEGEKNRLRAVGWHVLDLDEPCYRKVTKPTFFFMPCCPLSLLNNVIFANRTGQLGNLILFCVSLKVAVADLSVSLQPYLLYIAATTSANACRGKTLKQTTRTVILRILKAVNHLLNIFRTTTTTLLNRQFCSVETTACLRRTNLLLEARRYLPKPGPNKQYKYDYSVLEGMAYTHKPLRLRRLGGRNPETGRKVNQRVGGGYKFDWFWVNFKREGPTDGSFYEEKASFSAYIIDANYSPFIALVIGAKGRRWILATEHMTAGDIIRTSRELPKILVHGKEGDSWPVGALMPGTIVNCVELYPNCTDNCIIARNAGTSATILRKAGDFVMIQAPSKREYCIKPQCMATVGRLSNVNRNKEPWGSMNMKRRMGIRMGSGLWHRKDGYCGRKVHPPLPPLTVEGPRPPRPQTNSVTLSKWDHNAIFGNGTTNLLFGFHR
ncbi:ribosomal protein L2 domain protein [Trichuris suis]|nr:ribosomal protein L2 domain protein [Trichuris suis]